MVRKIRGNSMMPTLEPGAVVFARKPHGIDVRDIVLARQGGREVVKRVARIEGDKLHLSGDNSLESTDSRELGPVNKSDILGVVFMHLPGATSARKHSTRTLVVMLAYAVIVLVLGVTQLVRFDMFAPLWRDIAGSYWATPLAAAIVTAEVFALPFLLDMRMSHLGRLTSFLCGWAVAAGWLALSFVVASGSQIPLLGNFARLESGWWLCLLGLAMVAAMSVITISLMRPKR